MKKLFSALANTSRLRMVRALLRGPLNVSEITDVLGLGQSNVSHNLKILLDAGIVIRRGHGGWVYYSLNRNDDSARSLIDCVSTSASTIESYENDMTQLSLCYSARRAESRDFFNRMAVRMDKVSYLMPDPEIYIGRVLDLHQSPDSVVDAGCGSGDLVLKLAGRGNHAIGVDQSQEMLSEARRKLAAHLFSGSAELRLGNAEHLPLADGSVDGVIAHMLLHHLGQPAEFFSEAGRVCKDDGRCTVVELTPHGNADLKRMQGDLWPGLEITEVVEWMTRSGFIEIEEIESEDDRMFILSGTFRGGNGNG